MDDGIMTLSDLPGDASGFLAERLCRLRAAIADAARRGGHPAEEVQVVAVTKYVNFDVVRALYRLGVRDFGERRVQELVRKAEGLRDLEDARFHLVGHLQRNKVRKALEHSRVIHSLDSPRLLVELERQSERLGVPFPEIYAEVNISGESQKTGLAPDELPSLLEAVNRCAAARARVRGIMAMAPLVADPEESRPYFRRLRELRDACRNEGLLPADAGLSMGMTGDFRVAVEEGATVVRIGMFLYEEAD